MPYGLSFCYANIAHIRHQTRIRNKRLHSLLYTWIAFRRHTRKSECNVRSLCVIPNHPVLAVLVAVVVVLHATSIYIPHYAVTLRHPPSFFGFRYANIKPVRWWLAGWLKNIIYAKKLRQKCLYIPAAALVCVCVFLNMPGEGFFCFLQMMLLLLL